MRVRIFQPKEKVESSQVSTLYEGENLKEEKYRLVFDGYMNAVRLDDVYMQLNDDYPPTTYQGGSMKVGDVIEVLGDFRPIYGTVRTHTFATLSFFSRDEFEAAVAQMKKQGHEYVATVLGGRVPNPEQNGYYLCQPIGWSRVNLLHPEKVQPMEGLRVVMLEPGRPPYVTRIRNDLASMQRAVSQIGEESLIECTYPLRYDNGVVCVSNEEAKLIGMAGNRIIGGEEYAGPMFLVGSKGPDFVSLTDAQVELEMGRFKIPEEITREQVMQSMGFGFYPGME